MKKVWIRTKRDVSEAVLARNALVDAFAVAGWAVAQELDSTVNLIICISGDGTLLSTLQDIGDLRFKIPVLGIHGSYGLGFLHGLDLPQNGTSPGLWAKILVDALSSERYKIEKRWGLEGRLLFPEKQADPGDRTPIWSFNDLVIAKGALSRMVRLRISVDGFPLMDKARGDGMIISTAQGSTGYAMSAGGPVVHPNLRSITLTPVCLHSMSTRPLVVHGDSKIQLEILESSSNCYLTMDGQRGFELNTGQVVEVSSAQNFVPWMVLNEPTLKPFLFYEVLKDKLKFGESS